MTNHSISDNIFDLYSVNDDYAGYRDVSDQKENIDYHDNSIVRIWYNNQSCDYESHWHNALEIIVPTENYYDVIADNQSFHLVPDNILIIPPSVLHEINAPDSGQRFIYLLDITLISKLKGYASLESYMLHPLLIRREQFSAVNDELINLLTQMRTEYFNRTPYSELAIYALLANLFVTLGRNRLKRESLFPNSHSYKQSEYVQKLNDLLDYIDVHYAENISLDFAADLVGFSKYHFSRLFKQYIGCTFCEYLVQKRLKVAEKLLDDSAFSITEVFLQTGFQSFSTFNRLFKQNTGLTPSQYRLKCQTVNFKTDSKLKTPNS